jgi:hypothetical protein
MLVEMVRLNELHNFVNILVVSYSQNAIEIFNPAKPENNYRFSSHHAFEAHSARNSGYRSCIFAQFERRNIG